MKILKISPDKFECQLNNKIHRIEEVFSGFNTRVTCLLTFEVEAIGRINAHNLTDAINQHFEEFENEKI